MAVHPHSKSISQTHIKVNVPVTITFRRPFGFGQMLHFLVAGAAVHREMSFYTVCSSIKGHLAVSYWLWELNPRQSLMLHFGRLPLDGFSEQSRLKRKRGVPSSSLPVSHFCTCVFTRRRQHVDPCMYSVPLSADTRKLLRQSTDPRPAQ